MEKEDRNKEIFMKEIENIYDEMAKSSTGCFKDKDGDIYYLLNGKPHKSDGPVIQYADSWREWWFYGKIHRFDGPAIE